MPGVCDVISGIRCVSLWTGKPQCADASPVVALKSWRKPLSISAIPGGDERDTDCGGEERFYAREYIISSKKCILFLLSHFNSKPMVGLQPFGLSN